MEKAEENIQRVILLARAYAYESVLISNDYSGVFLIIERISDNSYRIRVCGGAKHDVRLIIFGDLRPLVKWMSVPGITNEHNRRFSL